MDTFWPGSSSAVAPSASRPGSCRCARCCRRRNWSSGPRTARPTGDFRDVIRTFSPSPPQTPQPHPPSRRQPRPHPYRRPSCQPHSTMVGKVSERVLAREGKHHPLSIRRDGLPHAGSPWTGALRAPWLTPRRSRANRQWHEAEQLAGRRSHQPEELLHVSLSHSSHRPGHRRILMMSPSSAST